MEKLAILSNLVKILNLLPLQHPTGNKVIIEAQTAVSVNVYTLLLQSA